MEQHHDEKELMAQISAGNVRAFEKLFHRYFQKLHNVAYNRIGSAAVADDLVQDVFADIWKNRASLSIRVSLDAYLYQAVKNKVLKFIRHRNVREKEEYVKRIRDEYYESKAFPGSDEILEHEELNGLIRAHLDQMPEKTQNIFFMSRNEHCTHHEIAEQLNCSPKTVEYHIGKVLKHLRVSLKNYMTILILFYLSLFM